ncbi:hypothetical protein GCM10010149_69350 [Nonomuraea roseoviolacea subsp. roseoviolacea]|uniref:Uncharacterized protein n=1 Tax=Nonomuraea roseoviolacea subsp. carminata TaxID=160689 RepID=A0ABT1JWX5_9ACTN|nr:hypothetical protein [Nonomuraea roseoviolacea]MCP2346261.1 hypothetical protein [Nonomuraea roseoviolacea subsp. carminata]
MTPEAMTPRPPAPGGRAEGRSGARQGGQWWRAALALGAFGVAAAAVYGIFSSGFGRPPRAAALDPPPPPVESSPRTPPPGVVPSPAGAPAGPAQAPPPPGPASTLAVLSADLWFTHLPAGLTRTGGGAADTGPGTRTVWAVWSARPPSGPGIKAAGHGTDTRAAGYEAGGRFVEARADHGAIAASWAAYRRTAPPGSRETAVGGRPAMVGRDPRGGRTVVWLVRPGTGVRVRVGEPIAAELLPVAASMRSPVGDWGGFP